MTISITCMSGLLAYTIQRRTVNDDADGEMMILMMMMMMMIKVMDVVCEELSESF